MIRSLLLCLCLAAPAAQACIAPIPPNLTAIAVADAVVTGRFTAIAPTDNGAILTLEVDEVLVGEMESPAQVFWGFWMNNFPPEAVTDHPVLVPLVTELEGDPGSVPAMPGDFPVIVHPACAEALILDPDSPAGAAVMAALSLPDDMRRSAMAEAQADHALAWGHMAGWLIP